MIISKPPESIIKLIEIDIHHKHSNVAKRKNVFLAGSIEMGSAEEWQKEIENQLDDINVHIYNPRRDDWDSSWEQKITNKQFTEQVDWELRALDHCDIIFMYLSPDTMSPISLMELGMHLKSGKLMVCCPDGFKRKGNVEIVCAKYDIPTYDTLEKAIAGLKLKL